MTPIIKNALSLFKETTLEQFQKEYKENKNCSVALAIFGVSKDGSGILSGVLKGNLRGAKNFEKEVLPKILDKAMENDEHEILCIGWQKLIKKKVLKENGNPLDEADYEMKKGLLMVFEEAEETTIKCIEMKFTDSSVDENGNFIPGDVEFGEELSLSDTSGFEHRFRKIITRY